MKATLAEKGISIKINKFVDGLATAITSPKDYKLPNRSSIVLLLEYGSARPAARWRRHSRSPNCQLSAAYLTERQIEQLPLSAFKLPHHGSAANLTADIIALAPADHYLFSADGSSCSRPSRPHCGRSGVGGRHWWEVDLSSTTGARRAEMWDDDSVIPGGYRFTTRYPAPGSVGVTLTLAGSHR